MEILKLEMCYRSGGNFEESILLSAPREERRETPSLTFLGLVLLGTRGGEGLEKSWEPSSERFCQLRCPRRKGLCGLGVPQLQLRES